jgi:hypothetical protein
MLAHAASSNAISASELKNGLFVKFYESYYGFLTNEAAATSPNSISPVAHRPHGRANTVPYKGTPQYSPFPSPVGTPAASLIDRNPAQSIMLLQPTENMNQSTPYLGNYGQAEVTTRFFYQGDMGEQAALSYTDRTTTFDHYNTSSCLYNVKASSPSSYSYPGNNPYTYFQQEGDFPDARQYSMMATGYLKVPAGSTGDWRITFGADDDAFVWVGPSALPGAWGTHNIAVDAGGLHGNVYETRIINFPTAGYYPIRLIFSENGGGDDCSFEFAGPGIGNRWDGEGFLFSKATETGF